MLGRGGQPSFPPTSELGSLESPQDCTIHSHHSLERGSKQLPENKAGATTVPKLG